ncbi:MAG: RNA-guided pseudouridylation complex pseudouridine synthase subunit Cbf5 [Thaumarchaeota archaeon]|nr:RNA-guided pseudouridylation complex pseudouridine synthase subunit Cbf5 [Nitrososphaerota archaeon]
MHKQRTVVIDEEESDPRYGSVPLSRSVEAMLQYGLIALDKPRGPTSHEVVAWVRKMLGTEKAGHSGTLDPPVSGVLPIGLGHATKALSVLLSFPKEYVGLMRLHSSVPRNVVDAVVAEFTGDIFQKPPQRSSVKREVRTRRIHELEVVETEGNLYLLKCLCESGTYIRKLMYDMGEVLGVGGTMVELRRTKVGPLTEEAGLTTLHTLSDAVFRLKSGDESVIRGALRPIEDCLGGTKRIVIRDSAVDAVCHGARLAMPGVLSASEGIAKGESIALMSGKGELVALGNAMMSGDEMGAGAKGLASTTERVVMKAGTYPKLWKTHAKIRGPEKGTGRPA